MEKQHYKMNIAEGKKEPRIGLSICFNHRTYRCISKHFWTHYFSYLNGGDSFVNSLPKTFSLGGEPSLYSILCLLKESLCCNFHYVIIILLEQQANH
jgi:hypothetical protein